MASSGVGAAQHVAGELFMAMTGVQPALADLLAGKAQVRFGIPLESMEYINLQSFYCCWLRVIMAQQPLAAGKKSEGVAVMGWLRPSGRA